MNRRNTLLCVVVAALSMGVFAGMRGGAVAAEKAAQGGRIAVRTESTDDKLKGQPVMVSILADGKIVGQWETKLGNSDNSSVLPYGTYDVRVEGEGCVTVVKRGITLVDTAHTILCPMSAGRGVHIVEYAAGGMPREEVADKL